MRSSRGEDSSEGRNSAARLRATRTALVASGCATSATPKGATLAQKITDDGAALSQIMLDVEQKCGPQFVSLTPVLNNILSVAKDPTNVIGDIIAAIDAYAPLKADAGAALCVDVSACTAHCSRRRRRSSSGWSRRWAML